MISPELITGCLAKFDSFDISQQQVEQYHRLVGSKNPYIIYFTPRSGSSYLADLLTTSHAFGAPGEFLTASLMDLTLKDMRDNGYSGSTIVDYFSWLIQKWSSENGAFGFKVSYFDYEPLIHSGLDKLLFRGFKPVLLLRKNILKQAMSLYIAVESGLFHTNIPVSEDSRTKAKSLPYDRAKIRYWIKHIAVQEVAFEKYLEPDDMNCLALDYDGISSSPADVLRSIARHLDAEFPEDLKVGASVFQKVRTENNERLMAMFLADESNGLYLLELGLDKSRLVGE